MSQEVRSDENTIDAVHIEFPDGTIDPVPMEVSDGTMDVVHMKFPDGTMDAVLLEVSDGTMDLDHMKFPDVTIDPVLSEVSAMDSDHVDVSDELDPNHMEDSVELDPNHMEDSVELDPNHMEDSVELDSDQVHTKIPDELWLKIKSFLNAADLTKLGATSHRYNSLSKDPALWQKLVIDIRQINNHYQSLEAVIGRATQLKYITITDKMPPDSDDINVDENALVTLIEKAKSFVEGMLPDSDEINVDENALVTLIEKAKSFMEGMSPDSDEINVDENALVTLIEKAKSFMEGMLPDSDEINIDENALVTLIDKAKSFVEGMPPDSDGINVDENALVTLIEKAKSFVEEMPPDSDEINVDENALVTLIEKTKATLISLTVGRNDDEIDNDLENDELDIELKNETIVKFGCLSRLESLELCGNDLSSSGVKAIAKLKNLKVLKIPGLCCNIKIKKTVMKYLFENLKNLRVVDLSHHRITNETLSILAQNNPNLEELKLYGCRGLNIGNFDVGSSMPNLRNLTLKSTAISKKGLSNMVKNCTQLSYLDLKWCYNFNKGFFGVLKKNCPNLEHLKLGYLPPDVLKTAGLRVFTTHFKKLKSLDLSEFHQGLHSCADEEFLQAMANRGVEIELRSSMC